jgi:menaquinol-cytochrome c reductase cytochrome b subunit
MIARTKARTRQWGRDLADWMEERTGLISITEKLLYEPTPKRGK